MNRDDQEMVRWYHRILRKAADHRLMVYFHGSYKPTGLQRTYEWFCNNQGHVRGCEALESSDELASKQ